MLLRGLGVRSGISATAGERYIPMANSVTPRAMINIGRLMNRSETGRSIMETTAAAVPPTINGIRFPSLVSTRSEKAPITGSRNTASTLSAATIAPMAPSFK